MKVFLPIFVRETSVKFPISTSSSKRVAERSLANGPILPSLLGGRRAADIVVNVLLPFAFAWGNLNSQPELARRAFGLYRFYPKLAVNALERHMSNQLGLNRSLVNSAQRQQGLIHIYKTLCSQGRCDSCPLKQSPSSIY